MTRFLLSNVLFPIIPIILSLILPMIRFPVLSMIRSPKSRAFRKERSTSRTKLLVDVVNLKIHYLPANKT